MAIHISVLEEKTPLFAPLRKKRKQAAGLLREKVIPTMTVTLADRMLPENYPWSFVVPLAGKRHKRFVTGALMKSPVVTREGNQVFALGAIVTHAWLNENLLCDFPMAFWLARMLTALQRQDDKLDDFSALQKWTKALARSYSPFWESLLLKEPYQFRHQADALLFELREDEKWIGDNQGGKIMPWQGWPACINRDDVAWLWRQSRNGRVIDSQKVAL